MLAHSLVERKRQGGQKCSLRDNQIALLSRGYCEFYKRKDSLPSLPMSSPFSTSYMLNCKRKHSKKFGKRQGGVRGGNSSPTTQTLLFTCQILTKNFYEPSALSGEESSKQDTAGMVPGLTNLK